MTTDMTIRAPREADFTAWKVLWKDYLTFYESSVTEDVTENTWNRLMDGTSPFFCFVAEDSSGNLVGTTHCVLHPSTWTKKDCCYLEDLFVSPNVRGKGVGRALIDAVIARAKKEDWERVHWLTARENNTARFLYDTYTTAAGWAVYEVEDYG